jgi:Prokaryotic E2 family E
MRNLRRLAVELQVLVRRYGQNNIPFHENGDWILINNFKLPKNKYNMDSCRVLIIIPPDYDDAEITWCHVDANLKWKSGIFGKNLPHSYKGKQFSFEGYQWVCFEATPGNPSNSGLLDFINTLRAYFTNPWIYQEL